MSRKNSRDEMSSSYVDGHFLWLETAGPEKSGLLLSQFLNLSLELAQKQPKTPVSIIIVAGEANQEEYERGAQAFESLLAKPNVSLEFSAGPVLSGNSAGRSIVLDLAAKFPETFIAIYRRLTRADEHWKVTSVGSQPSLLQIELPHRAVPKHDCQKVTISERAYFLGTIPESISVHGVTRPFKSVFEIKHRGDGIIEAIPTEADQQVVLKNAFQKLAAQKVEWFEKYYRTRLPKLNGEEAGKLIKVLPTKTLQQIEEWMRKKGGSYDSANVAEIIASEALLYK